MNKSKLTDWQKKEATRYLVAKTGRKIKAVNVSHGTYEDIKTGERYMSFELKSLGERRQMWQITLRAYKVGVSLFARQYLKYKTCQFGLSFDSINGYDRYFDIEAKILFFGVGVRFIWIKKKK